MKQKFLISFFIIQAVAWFVMVAIPYLNPPPEIHHYLWNFHVKHLGGYFLLILFFNLNFFYWIPNYFQKSKFVPYSLCILFSLVAVIAYETTIFECFFPKFRIKEFRIHLVPVRDFVLLFGMSSGFRALYDWFTQREERGILISEKKAAELAVLRHQLSPHFLFNTLNNITELMHKDVNEAEKYITNFSNLLREMLQKEDAQQITLREEILFIENYVGLQKIRLNSNHKLDFQVIGKLGEFMIEPFLLINFIENVFKHGLSNNVCEIKIHILLKENEVILKTVNEINTGRKDNSTGIGMRNVKKRLEICYPNKHHLDIHTENNTFQVEMYLNLQ